MKLVASGAPRRMPPSDLALLTAALLLMFGGAAALVADVVSAGLAIPLIAIGIALTLVVQGQPAVPRLNWPAAPGWRYTVERTLDWLNWAGLATRIPSVPGPESYDDLQHPAVPAFYRLAITPEMPAAAAAR